MAKATAKKRTRTPTGGADNKTSSALRLLSLLAIAIGLFGILLGAALTYLGMQSQLALEQAGRAADDKARVVGAALNEIQAALRDGEVANQALRSLEGGGRDDLHSAFRRRGVASMIDLRAFDLAIEDIQPGLFPEPDFAAIEMMISARRDGRAPIQVHFPGTPNENIAFAQRIERDGEAAGVLFLRVPVSAVTSLVNDLGPLNYVAIVQGRGEQASTLRSLGSPTGGQASRIAIPNSLLAIEWSRATVGVPVAGRTAIIIGFGGLLLLLSGIVVRSRIGTPAAVMPESDKPAAASVALDDTKDVAEAESKEAPEPVATPPVQPAVSTAEPPPAKPASSTNDLPDWLLDAELDPEPGPDSEPAAEAAAGDGDRKPEASDDGRHDVDEEVLVEQSASAESTVDDEADAAVEPKAVTGNEADDLDLDLDLDTEEPQADEAEPLDLDFDFSSRKNGAAEPPETKEGQESSELDASADQASEASPPVSSSPTLIEASLFRAHRIGGVVEKTLDARSATLIGQAIGSEARDRGISSMVIGRDGRLFGAPLLSALGQGLRGAGVDVIDLGAVPIPALNLAAHEWTGGSGVMVTGSHLPPDQSGFVIRLAGEVFQGPAIEALHERILQSDLASGNGSHEERNIVDHYAERIGADIQLERPLKVVVDCGNGITGSVVPQVFSAIGADVIPLYCDVDGNFPNHLPNPADPDNLEDLILCVRNFRADLGIAFDGDGDRIGVVAPDGEVIWPDRLLMLLARDLLQREPGALVVHDVACSGLLREFVENHGGQTRIARSADSFVAEKMREESARLAGLMSGHLFVAERWYPFDDGIFAAARLLELLAADTRPVDEIIAELPTRKATPEYRRPMTEEASADLVMALIAEGDFDDGQISTLDGLRVDYEDGFGMVRASHRGAELVFRFEGEDAKVITRIQNLFKREIAKQTPDLKLIF